MSRPADAGVRPGTREALLVGTLLPLASILWTRLACAQDDWGAPPGSPGPDGPGVLTDALCLSARTGFLITLAGYAAVCLIPGVLWNMRLERRRAWGAGARFLVPGLVASAIACGLVAWNPLADDTLLRCLSNPELRWTIPLGQYGRSAQSLVLGFLPTLVLYAAVVMTRVRLGRG